MPADQGGHQMVVLLKVLRQLMESGQREGRHGCQQGLDEGSSLHVWMKIEFMIGWLSNEIRES